MGEIQTLETAFSYVQRELAEAADGGADCGVRGRGEVAEGGFVVVPDVEEGDFWV